MHRLLIILMLVVGGISLFAEDNTAEQITFGLISAPEYNLDMRMSLSLKRVYVTAEFVVQPDSSKSNDYYSFFISKDAKIEQAYINSKRAYPLLTTNLVPEHFDPVLSVPALLDSSSLVLCYSFDNTTLMKEPASIKVTYWIPLPEWHPTDDGKGVIGFMADEYWFPRNIEYDSTVNIELQSTESYKLEIDTPCSFSDDEGIRMHKGCFRDGIGKSAFLKIIKG